MAAYLALYEEKLNGSLRVQRSAAPRALFVHDGEIDIECEDGRVVMQAGACRLFESSIEILGTGTVWSFEIGAGGVSQLPAARQASLILAHDLALDPTRPMVFRCDRVDFPPGACTPRHGHKGSGIRRLIHGLLMAEVGNEWRRLGAGDAWFESGLDPVVGRNLADSSAFVRAMVLPERLHGRPTFVPWDDQEAGKPRGTQRTEFFDTVVRIGNGAG